MLLECLIVDISLLQRLHNRQVKCQWYKHDNQRCCHPKKLPVKAHHLLVVAGVAGQPDPALVPSAVGDVVVQAFHGQEYDAHNEQLHTKPIEGLPLPAARPGHQQTADQNQRKGDVLQNRSLIEALHCVVAPLDEPRVGRFTLPSSKGGNDVVAVGNSGAEGPQGHREQVNKLQL